MTAAEFVAAYTPADAARVAFAWNGKHGEEFADTNQAFRGEVVDWCLAHLKDTPVGLLCALVKADSDWAVQAWAVPDRFPQLAGALLSHNDSGPDELDVFISAAQASYDTYCSCYHLKLEPELLVSLAAGVAMRGANTLDEDEVKRLKHIGALFAELRIGTAAAHLQKVVAEAPVVQGWWEKVKQMFGS